MSKELGKQIRAARGLLGWHQTMLSARSGVSTVTIGALETGKMGGKEKGAERKKGRTPPERIPYDATIKALRDALEGAGIEFINISGEDGDWLGVRLRIPKMREAACHLAIVQGGLEDTEEKSDG
jgi:transcriptional regulator with XRE-family HTH domain